MKIFLSAIPHDIELACDRCPLGAAQHMARHRYRETSHMIGVVEMNMCGRCLSLEIDSWDGRGGFAPEFVPPVVTAPVPRTLIGWPLGPFPRVESA